MGKVIKHYKYKGKWKEKEVNDPECLSKDDVLGIIREDNWKEFEKWIYGQAGPVMADNSCGYYAYDLQKYKRHYIDGEVPLSPDDIMEIFQDMELKKIEVSNSLRKINTREWNSSRKGAEVENNQKKKKKKPGFRSGLKRNKKRWNKKRGKKEISKKGSREHIHWSD